MDFYHLNVDNVNDIAQISQKRVVDLELFLERAEKLTPKHAVFCYILEDGRLYEVLFPAGILKEKLFMQFISQADFFNQFVLPQHTNISDHTVPHSHD